MTLSKKHKLNPCVTEPPKFYVTQTFKMGKFDTATQTLCYVSGLHNFRGFNPPPRVFRSGYVNTKRVLFCFYKIILIRTCELKTSPPCLHTLIRYCSCREDIKSIFSRQTYNVFFYYMDSKNTSWRYMFAHTRFLQTVA